MGNPSSALVGVTDAEGRSIFSGKEATGFSNAEEEQAGKVKVFKPVHLASLQVLIVTAMQDIPFLLESEIIQLGGKYTKADEPWGVRLLYTQDGMPYLTQCCFR